MIKMLVLLPYKREALMRNIVIKASIKWRPQSYTESIKTIFGNSQEYQCNVNILLPVFGNIVFYRTENLDKEKSSTAISGNCHC